jgi:hypothetical protein
VRVMTASGEDITESGDPERVIIRRAPAALVYLKGAKSFSASKRAGTGRCEGRKPLPREVVLTAKRLGREGENGQRNTGTQLWRPVAACGWWVSLTFGPASPLRVSRPSRSHLLHQALLFGLVVRHLLSHGARFLCACAPIFWSSKLARHGLTPLACAGIMPDLRSS